jgi:hypothetical protein
MAMLYNPEIFFIYVSDTHFCYMPGKPQGLVWLEELGKLKNSYLAKNSTYDPKVRFLIPNCEELFI